MAADCPVFASVNPATGETLGTYPVWTVAQTEAALSSLPSSQAEWSAMPLPVRAALLQNCAKVLDAGRDRYARLISLEMGKLIGEAHQEIAKCIWALDYFAESGAGYMQDEIVATQASRSLVAFEPLGTVLAIMPWNFPFWQVFRAAVPILLAGNTVLLKHAPNVTGCALAIGQIFLDAGFPPGVMQNLTVGVGAVRGLLADRRVQGVTFTGGVRAGREVAQWAGFHLKKAVLELGGSDPFIVLEDADLGHAAAQAAAARYANAGQSCIAAKRIIVVESVVEAFIERLYALALARQTGDPLSATANLAPLARPDLRDNLHRQVTASLTAGAKPLLGCQPVAGTGCFYPASLLDQVAPGMAAFDEELFGPVAAVIRARDEAEAVRLANQTVYGLGGSVWTGDPARGERVIRQLHCGMGFVNAIVQSDPRLPCGGVKDSGYGRELSHHGLREFVNVKTVWVN